jgi:hypothetical protein
MFGFTPIDNPTSVNMPIMPIDRNLTKVTNYSFDHDADWTDPPQKQTQHYCKRNLIKKIYRQMCKKAKIGITIIPFALIEKKSIKYALNIAG